MTEYYSGHEIGVTCLVVHYENPPRNITALRFTTEWLSPELMANFGFVRERHKLLFCFLSMLEVLNTTIPIWNRRYHLSSLSI